MQAERHVSMCRQHMHPSAFPCCTASAASTAIQDSSLMLVTTANAPRRTQLSAHTTTITAVPVHQAQRTTSHSTTTYRGDRPAGIPWGSLLPVLCTCQGSSGSQQPPAAQAWHHHSPAKCIYTTTRQCQATLTVAVEADYLVLPKHSTCCRNWFCTAFAPLTYRQPH